MSGNYVSHDAGLWKTVYISEQEWNIIKETSFVRIPRLYNRSTLSYAADTKLFQASAKTFTGMSPKFLLHVFAKVL